MTNRRTVELCSLKVFVIPKWPDVGWWWQYISTFRRSLIGTIAWRVSPFWSFHFLYNMSISIISIFLWDHSDFTADPAELIAVAYGILLCPSQFLTKDISLSLWWSCFNDFISSKLTVFVDSLFDIFSKVLTLACLFSLPVHCLELFLFNASAFFCWAPRQNSMPFYIYPRLSGLQLCRWLIFCWLCEYYCHVYPKSLTLAYHRLTFRVYVWSSLYRAE